MASYIVPLALTILGVVAAWSIKRRIRRGSSCCGSQEGLVKKARDGRANKAEYPFVYQAEVDGMHCANCATRVENALFKSGERWAEADLSKRELMLYAKAKQDRRDAFRTIADAGYTMITWKTVEEGEEK